MMSNIQKTNQLDQLETQELRDLLTLSTGSIDAYIIESQDKVPMLLPQSIVLAALDSLANVEFIQWHDFQLPFFNLNGATQRNGVALVIEGESNEQRFALLCKSMPRAMRIRISDMVDDESQPILDLTIKHYVRIANKIYHVPDLNYIQKQMGLL